MKTRLLIIASLVLSGCLLSLAGCGGGTASFSSGNGTTGTITLNVAWPQNATVKAVPGVKMMAGAVTVRLAVSGPGMTTVTKDFPLEAGQGTIDGVPVGVERVLKVLGLDGAGAVLYSGEVTNITVVAGQTSDVGTVVMEPVGVYSISGKITLDGGVGLAGVTITAESSTIAYATAALTASYSATTDANGDYTISGLPSGTYLLTASKTDYTFTPESQTVIIDTTNLAGQDFAGAPGTPYFPIAVGNKWTYDYVETVLTASTTSGTTTVEISAVDGTGFTLNNSFNQSSQSSYDVGTSVDNLVVIGGNYYLQSSSGEVTNSSVVTGNAIKAITQPTMSFTDSYASPYYLAFMGQLDTGATVSGSTNKSSIITSGGYTYSYTYAISNSYVVVGPAVVTVPAGSFNAIRVDFTETVTMTSPSAQQPQTRTGSYWYVPYVGMVKKEISTGGGSSTAVLTSYQVK